MSLTPHKAYLALFADASAEELEQADEELSAEELEALQTEEDAILPPDPEAKNPANRNQEE